MDSTTSSISSNLTSALSTSTANASGSAVTKTAASAAAAKTAKSATTATPKADVEPQRDPRSLQFQVDGDRVITTVVDENNNTVVLQIPDADMIRIAKAIDRMQGFLVQEKA